MGYVRYILISFFGVMPRIILITLLGDKIYDLIPVKFMMTVVIIVIIVAAVTALVKYVRKE